MRSRFSRVTAIVCSCLLASAPIQSALAEAADPDRLASAMDATAEALEAIAAAAPRTDFEVPALAASIDGDSGALSAWVQAHIAPDAYRGELKGAEGALEDRRGNSLDRALLLAALVKAKGGTARLARTTLESATALKLAETIAEESHTPAAALDATRIDPILAALESDTRINGAALKAAREKAEGEAAAASAAGDALRSKVTAGLVGLVGSRLLGETATAVMLADHWWVQVEQGGVWVDLDPDAATVGALSATETMDADAVPQSEKHRVTLRVVAETAPRGGALTTTTLLERTYDTADVNGRILSLATQPLNAPGLDTLAATKGDIAADYRAGTAWLPVLVADGPEIQNLIRDDGAILEATDANIQQQTGVAAAFGGNTSGLDQIGSGEEEPAEAASAGQFTSAWIEFEITAPGAPARTERRVIFDAIGAEARANGAVPEELTDAALAARGQALRDTYAIVIQGGAISPARAASRFAASVAMARRFVANWLRGGASETGPLYPDEFRLPNLELTAWAMGRDGDVALAGTNIALLRDTALIGDDGLSMIQVFDIVANPVAGPNGAARLAAGVGDTVLEHQLMGAPDGSVNTAIAFAADLDAGKPWGVVTPDDPAALDTLGLAPDAAALIRSDLARGAVVVARPGATLADATWWRIDPATGETVGMTAAGGSEAAEYVVAASIWVVVFGGAIKLRCERSGGRRGGQSYAECAAASYSNPFARAGEAVKKKIGGALDAASGDALKGF